MTTHGALPVYSMYPAVHPFYYPYNGIHYQQGHVYNNWITHQHYISPTNTPRGNPHTASMASLQNFKQEPFYPLRMSGKVEGPPMKLEQKEVKTTEYGATALAEDEDHLRTKSQDSLNTPEDLVKSEVQADVTPKVGREPFPVRTWNNEQANTHTKSKMKALLGAAPTGILETIPTEKIEESNIRVLVPVISQDSQKSLFPGSSARETRVTENPIKPKEGNIEEDKLFPKERRENLWQNHGPGNSNYSSRKPLEESSRPVMTNTSKSSCTSPSIKGNDEWVIVSRKKGNGRVQARKPIMNLLEIHNEPESLELNVAEPSKVEVKDAIFSGGTQISDSSSAKIPSKSATHSDNQSEQATGFLEANCPASDHKKSLSPAKLPLSKAIPTTSNSHESKKMKMKPEIKNHIIQEMNTFKPQLIECVGSLEANQRFSAFDAQFIQEYIVHKWKSMSHTASKEVFEIAKLFKAGEDWPVFYDTKLGDWEKLVNKMQKLKDSQYKELTSLIDINQQHKRLSLIYLFSEKKTRNLKAWLTEADLQKLMMQGVSAPTLLKLDWNRLNRRTLESKASDLSSLMTGNLLAHPHVYTVEEAGWYESTAHTYILRNVELSTCFKDRLKLISDTTKENIYSFKQWFPEDDIPKRLNSKGINLAETFMVPYFGIDLESYARLKLLMEMEKEKRSPAQQEKVHCVASRIPPNKSHQADPKELTSIFWPDQETELWKKQADRFKKLYAWFDIHVIEPSIKKSLIS
ncbi:hypothetical protein CROQUDRAFT_135721 [Cronartium quercuum f. sp. fusiforme G11]|uniref:Uncharacterized protein n=1 Tax=Cronartium quercuum f. sp. fusiforme G11 TaxID=708437 RepID=A0A9P6NA91_9BASI|nr:hypothetical protein CROQUDRAFT_135721 [Cronartium quercuum f. sp. fusiforme G11]